MYPVQTIESQDAKKPTLCFGCLSSNRKLRPLGEYYNIFHQLIDDDTYLMQQSDILLCWECRGALRKAVLFKEKVAHAQSILSSYPQGPTSLTIPPEPLTTFTVATCDSVCTLTMAMEKTYNYYQDVIIKPVKLEKEENTDLREPIEKNYDYVCNQAVDDNDWDEERFNDDDERFDDDIDNNGKILEMTLKTRQQNIKKENKNICDKKDGKEVKKFENDGSKHKPKRKKVKEEENYNFKPLETEGENKSKMRELATPISIKHSDTVIVVAKKKEENDPEKKKAQKGPKKKEEDPDYMPSEEEMTDEIKKLSTPIKIKSSDTVIAMKNKNRDFSKDYYFTGIQNIRAVQKHTKLVPIDLNEISQYMERDRNSELFRSVKYKCEKCVETFTKTALRKHGVSHVQTLQKDFVCNVCGIAIADKAAYGAHVSKHGFIRECLTCGIKICSRSLMSEHLKIHKIRVQCTDCKETFGGKRKFYYHYRAAHSTCICDYCGKKTLYKQKMEMHILKRHGKTRYCDLCQKTVKNYENHLKIRHAPHRPEEAFCVECNLQFINIYTYKQHLRTTVLHNPKLKIRRYPCPDCERAFKSNADLQDHHDWVHKGTSRYQCDQCSKSFARNHKLRAHIDKVHLGKMPKKDKICTYCGRGFTLNQILIHHMRTHTGERPHVCEHCGAGFAQKVAMRSHVKKHHGSGMTHGVTNSTPHSAIS